LVEVHVLVPFHHEVDGTVLQALHALVGEVVVDGASEDEQFVLQVVPMFGFEVEEVHTHLGSDVGVFDDLLDEVGVALFGQSLVPV
jgi:hypothetical protein